MHTFVPRDDDEKQVRILNRILTSELGIMNLILFSEHWKASCNCAAWLMLRRTDGHNCLEAWRQLCLRFKSTSGQSALGTFETIRLFRISGKFEEVETERGRCELLLDDQERSAHPAMIAGRHPHCDTCEGLFPTPRNSWKEVTSLTRETYHHQNHAKRNTAGNDVSSPMQIGALSRAPA